MLGARLTPIGGRHIVEQLLAAHPRLTKEAIQAALAFAADALRADIVYPLTDEAAWISSQMKALIARLWSGYGKMAMMSSMSRNSRPASVMMTCFGRRMIARPHC